MLASAPARLTHERAALTRTTGLTVVSNDTQPPAPEPRDSSVCGLTCLPSHVPWATNGRSKRSEKYTVYLPGMPQNQPLVAKPSIVWPPTILTSASDTPA